MVCVIQPPCRQLGSMGESLPGWTDLLQWVGTFSFVGMISSDVFIKRNKKRHAISLMGIAREL